VSRGEITDVLRKWQAGLLASEQVHEWAEDIFAPGELDFEDEDVYGNSVANEVLASLDSLDMNLVIVDDVPIYLEFLECAPNQFERGYRRFRDALHQIDIEARQRELRTNPLYAPFCEI